MLKNKFSLYLVCLGLILLTTATANAQTGSCSRIYVDSAVVTSGNGNSWATALKTVSQALDSANSGTCSSREIWVAKGTYYPMSSATAIASSQDSSFRILRNSIKIYGGFAGGETTLSARNVLTNPTILSGNIGVISDSTDNCYHVVTVVSNNTIDTSTRIDGFDIRRGYAYTIGSFNVAGYSLNRFAGGGMHLRSSSPTVANCDFNFNAGTSGGGMYNEASSPVITDCTFFTNKSTSSPSPSLGANGGEYAMWLLPLL